MSDDPYDDGFDVEGEAQDRYPWLSESSPPYEGEVAAFRGRGGSLLPVLHAVTGGEVAAESNDSADDSPNYHYLQELSEELLPTLNFYRFDNLFSAKPANSYLTATEEKPRIRRLFSDFWLEGELSILFADTGRGKSVLAVQIGRSIATGEPIPPFELEVPAQRVVYFDFELTDQQFTMRYTDPDSPNPQALPFPDNLIRCPPRDIDELPYGFKDYYEFMTSSLVGFIEFSKAKVVIVDNITWLNTSIENSVAALRLMKTLHQLKKRLGVSILVLAHTPKRHLSSTITINDMSGSKMLANFADNIFAIGKSWRGKKNLRYLKHIKPRNCELRYDALNVPVLRLEKNGNFLGFSFVEFGREREQVDWYRDPDVDRNVLIAKTRQLANEGNTQREIAEELGISIATVNRYIRTNSKISKI